MHSDPRREKSEKRVQEMEDVRRRLGLGPEDTEIESYLRQQQRLATLGLLISGIAHEVNNPLTTVVNYAQSIVESAPEDSPVHSYAGQILKSASWISALMRNMLDFVREGPKRCDPAHMGDIVNAALSLVHPLLSRSQVEVAVNIPPNLPAVLCRSQEIQQVLINLLTYSCDALDARYPSADPGKVISLRLQVVSTDGKDWVRTTVEDRGVGIAHEVQARIFEPLFTGKAATDGMGLGLWICQRIATSHHGGLWVESETGRFTRFHLDLPVHRDLREDRVHVPQQVRPARQTGQRTQERRAAS